MKLKRGKLLADLAQPGDQVVVAKGGQGGVSMCFLDQIQMLIVFEGHSCVS